MKTKLLFLTIFLFCLTYNLSSQEESDTIVYVETFLYSIKSEDTLLLDKYEVMDNNKELRPCVLFVFGGGFYAGSRNEEYYKDYYNFLAKNGYVVVAIDYRLGFKKATEMKDSSNKRVKVKEFLNYFDYTISMAVEDLYDATLFVINNSEEWRIDTSKIIISGSSAGGITVLQAEYGISSGSVLSMKLPEDFNYAGVISFAGAIYSIHGKLKWKKSPAPIQMFHGDADKNVPYNKIKLFKYGIYGSKNIAKQLKKNKNPYYFYIGENEDHVLASSPMLSNQEEILSFLNKYVMEKKNLYTEVKVKSFEKPKSKKKYKIKDYVNSNFGS